MHIGRAPPGASWCQLVHGTCQAVPGTKRHVPCTSHGTRIPRRHDALDR